MPEGQAVFTADGSDLQVSPQLALDILPTSWLQVGVRPATAKVDRLRAAIFERLDWLHQAEAAGRQRREHQSIILIRLPDGKNHFSKHAKKQGAGVYPV
jgi:hypothetical protein